jgi:hypothetical protein
MSHAKIAHVARRGTVRHRLFHIFAFGFSWFLVSLLARSNREALEAARVRPGKWICLKARRVR